MFDLADFLHQMPFLRQAPPQGFTSPPRIKPEIFCSLGKCATTRYTAEPLSSRSNIISNLQFFQHCGESALHSDLPECLFQPNFSWDTVPYMSERPKVMDVVIIHKELPAPHLSHSWPCLLKQIVPLYHLFQKPFFFNDNIYGCVTNINPQNYNAFSERTACKALRAVQCSLVALWKTHYLNFIYT